MASSADILNGLSAVGTCVALTLFCSQLGLARKMWLARDDPEIATKYSVTPSYTLLAVSLLWGGYAHYVFHRVDLQILNSVGCLFSLSYILLFVMLTPSQTGKAKILAIAISMIIFSVFLYLICFSSDEIDGRNITGIITSCVNITMFASPATTIVHAVKHLDSTHVPLLFTLVCLASGLVWSVFALVASDIFLLVPNAIGTAICLLQLAALGYIKWRNTHEQGVVTTGISVAAVEAAAVVMKPLSVHKKLGTPSTKQLTMGEPDSGDSADDAAAQPSGVCIDDAATGATTSIAIVSSSSSSGGELSDATVWSSGGTKNSHGEAVDVPRAGLLTSPASQLGEVAVEVLTKE